MITFRYGNVTFTEVNIRGYERVAVLHGPDYLYTTHTLHMRALYNPGIDDKKFAATRDKEITPPVLVPRQELVLKVNDITWAEVDVGQKAKHPDLAQGPIPLYSTVDEVVGPKSAWVNIGIKFHVHETASKAALPMILSNRWTMTSSTNQQFWNSRRVTGEVVFNGASVTQAQRNLFRAFILPVENGYKRDSLEVTDSEDGLHCRYSFIDTQVPYVLMPTYVADAEIEIRSMTSMPSTDDVVMGSAGLLIGAAGLPSDIVSGRAFGSFSGGSSAGGGIAAALKSTAELTAKVSKFVVDLQPSVQIQVKATVMGLPQASMYDLLKVAKALAAYKALVIPDIKKTPCPFDIRSSNVATSHRNRVVVYTVILERSAVTSIWNNIIRAMKTGNLSELGKDPVSHNMEYYVNRMCFSKQDFQPGVLHVVDPKPQPIKDLAVVDGARRTKDLVVAALQIGETTDLDRKPLILSP